MKNPGTAPEFVPECVKSLVYASEMWLVHYNLLYQQKLRSHKEMMTLRV